MDPQEWDDVLFTPLAAWELWQGYLTRDGADPEVRVRMAREIAVESAADVAPHAVVDENGRETVLRRLAVKLRIPTDESGALSRHELEPLIDDAQFAHAWRLCEGRRLQKVRVEYMVSLPGGHRLIVVRPISQPAAWACAR